MILAVECFVVGILIGLLIGWSCGTWSEHRLWLNAICGREKIHREEPIMATSKAGMLIIALVYVYRFVAFAVLFAYIDGSIHGFIEHDTLPSVLFPAFMAFFWTCANVSEAALPEPHQELAEGEKSDGV